MPTGWVKAAQKAGARLLSQQLVEDEHSLDSLLSAPGKKVLLLSDPMATDQRKAVYEKAIAKAVDTAVLPIGTESVMLNLSGSRVN